MDANSQENYNQYATTGMSGINVRDLEEKQNILRERMILIGKNLVDFREENNKKILEIKREILGVKNDIEKIKSFLESISYQMDKFAKKDDLDILAKQAKMFQPISKKFQ